MRFGKYNCFQYDREKRTAFIIKKIREDLVRALREHNKATANKLLRQYAGLTLNEAKPYIDRLALEISKV